MACCAPPGTHAGGVLVGQRGAAAPSLLGLAIARAGRRSRRPRSIRHTLVATVRVMTYNILLGGRRGAPLHELVRTVAPDVLLVNEAPKRPLLSARDCRRLARLWGMRYVAGGRSAGSNMLLVRGPVEVRRADTVVLRQPRFQPRRGLVVAQLRVHGRLLGVVSCHLSLNAARRRGEVAEVIRQADTLRGLVVV